MRRRYGNGGAILADRPDELANLKAHYLERHANPLMPQDLDQITLATPEAEDFAAMRITAKALLHLQRQAVLPTAHVLPPGWRRHFSCGRPKKDVIY